MMTPTAPAWPFGLRQKWRQAASRRRMQRYAQLDPRFPGDIGLTPEEVGVPPAPALPEFWYKERLPIKS